MSSREEYRKEYYRRNRDKVREGLKRYREVNRERLCEQKKAWYRAKGRNTHLMETYGLSEVEYDAMLERQGFACAICGRTTEKTFHVDHDHRTGRVRGLLCTVCNLQIVPVVEKYQDRISRALDYLEVFWEKVKQEQLEKYSRVLSPVELQAVITEGTTPLAHLITEGVPSNVRL